MFKPEECRNFFVADGYASKQSGNALDGGKIVDSGAFEELAKRNADFKRMVKLASLDSEHTL